MQTHTIITYSFDELSGRAKQEAISDCRDFNVTDELWYEFVIDDAKRLAAIIGIEIDNIYFSGFWSQGDGAQFTGNYSYRKGGTAELIAEAPLDEELHRIAHGLQAIQSRNFYKLSARVESTGRYSHEMCTAIRVYRETEYSYCGDCAVETEETVQELLRDYMRWIYRRLESEHDYLTSDEAVIESIQANEYEFTESGSLYQC